MDFTHLHVHTGFSLLDGSGQIKDMVKRAKELDYDAMAITDHGVMYGCIDFYNACLDVGIKPIIGCEVYVAPGSRFDKEAQISDDRYHHLILLAMNNEGYQNLIKIVSIGFTEGFYYKPRVDHEILEKYHEGIICLSACLAGEIPSLIMKGFYEEAKETALWYENLFGHENFYLELQDHGIPEQRTVNQALLRMHEESGIPLVVTNDVHYTYKEDWEAHDVLLCLQTQKSVNDDNRLKYAPEQFHIRSKEEMYELFPYAHEALANSKRIADRCNVVFEFNNYKVPKFDVPTEESASDYLKRLCFEGLNRRYGADAPLHKERLDYELGVINSMGFVDYFLIVSDFIKYAKDNGIPVGPGRGSAAGSIVSYCLEITDIDPIKYQLIFERFLNPGRVTMPDIDIDFCYVRRQEVINYVIGKYGADRVVQIVTFGTLAARGVIRDVGRALDVPYAKCDMLSKMIPKELNITIDKALELNSELADLVETDEETANIIRIARRLEGLPRHTSIHAAGVVISNAPADMYVPLQRSSEDIITTQYTMTTVERLGLLKMDFLGLRTLTVIKNAEELAKKRTPDLSIKNLSYDDPKVFALISSGKTEGIFQLESEGMKSFMKELKPGNLEDVIAGISLYRPGPMDFIPKYIKGKNNRDSIEYDCKELIPILEPTYGCIVYQEQVMQIVRELAGYSNAQSDEIRKAMSKKKADVIARERQSFIYGDPERSIAGCVNRGISVDVANKIYDEMTDFAKYAFNKSHAACYAVVAYQTAFLKCYYPVEFMAALISSVIENGDKVTGYVRDIKAMGINILPPDVNICSADFGVDNGNIRYGLSAIKGLGRPVIDSIVAERNQNGPFKDIKDFCERLSGREVNKRIVEGFIKAGAFDSLPGNRRQLMQMYMGVMDSVALDKKKNLTGQMSIFDLLNETSEEPVDILTYPNVPEFSKAELLQFEKEVLGLYVSGHPLEDYDTEIKANVTRYAIDFAINEETDEPNVKPDEFAIIGGIVTDKNVKTTRSNSMMAFLTVEDATGTVEVVVFPKDYERLRSKLNVDTKAFIKGRVSVEADKPGKIIIQDFIPFDDMPKELWVKFVDIDEYKKQEETLARLVRESFGEHQVVIYVEATKQIKRLDRNQTIKADEVDLRRFKEHFGEKNVTIKKLSIKKYQ